MALTGPSTSWCDRLGLAAPGASSTRCRASMIVPSPCVRQCVRHRVDVTVEEPGVVRPGAAGEGLEPGARGQRRPRLVERHVAVGADPEQLQVDAPGGGDRDLVGGARRGQVLGEAVGPVHVGGSQVDPGDQLAVDDVAVPAAGGPPPGPRTRRAGTPRPPRTTAPPRGAAAPSSSYTASGLEPVASPSTACEPGRHARAPAPRRRPRRAAPARSGSPDHDLHQPSPRPTSAAPTAPTGTPRGASRTRSSSRIDARNGDVAASRTSDPVTASSSGAPSSLTPPPTTTCVDVARQHEQPHRRRHGPGDLVAHRHGARVPGGGCREQRDGAGRPAARATPRRSRCPRRTARRSRAGRTRTPRPSGHERHVPDLPRRARRAAPQRAVEQQPRGDPGAQRQEREVAHRLGRDVGPRRATAAFRSFSSRTGTAAERRPPAAAASANARARCRG